MINLKLKLCSFDRSDLTRSDQIRPNGNSLSKLTLQVAIADGLDLDALHYHHLLPLCFPYNLSQIAKLQIFAKVAIGVESLFISIGEEQIQRKRERERDHSCEHFDHSTDIPFVSLCSKFKSHCTSMMKFVQVNVIHKNLRENQVWPNKDYNCFFYYFKFRK